MFQTRFQVFSVMAAACAVLAVFVLAGPAMAAPDPDGDTLLITNHSHNDLVGVRFIQGKNISHSRLDLAPGNDEELEKPAGSAEIRLDLGLSMCSWPKVNLDEIRSITLCPDHENCIILTDQNGNSRHETGDCRSLLPPPGSAPVCALDKFRPRMTMRDACGLINTSYTSDDRALISTLGYAGLVWNARLYAGSGKNDSDITREQLEDIELRQKLTNENLKAVQDTLSAQNYIPWQATFPGVDMDFTEMHNLGKKDQADLLAICVDTFLKSGRGEASILYAPKDSLPDITTSDALRKDVQIFTLMLRRDSGTLILDMAAYTGDEVHE